MNILRTLENWRKISRIVKSFCISKEIWQLVEIRRNFELFEINVKKKIINRWFNYLTTFILFKFFNIFELSLHHIFQWNSINSCCFCRWAALVKVLLSSAWRWVCFLWTHFHSVSEMIRLHLQSRCIHLIQWSKSVSTQHFMKWLKQWLQERITELSLSRSFFERWRCFAMKLNDLNTQFKCIKMMISENRNLEEDLVLKHNLSWDRNYAEIRRRTQHDELWASKIMIMC